MASSPPPARLGWSSNCVPGRPAATCTWSAGPRTIQAFCQQGALDCLDVVVLPILLGDGVPLWPHGTEPPRLRLRREPRVFPDGSVELSYSTA
jgi:dihydrofolate reductase